MPPEKKSKCKREKAEEKPSWGPKVPAPASSSPPVDLRSALRRAALKGAIVEESEELFEAARALRAARRAQDPLECAIAFSQLEEVLEQIEEKQASGTI